MENLIAPQLNNTFFKATPLLLNFPQKRFRVDYDQEADVLYISFQRPQNATDSEMSDDGILYRYHGQQLVGVTIFEASSR